MKSTYLTIILSEQFPVRHEIEHTMELLGELSTPDCMKYCRKLRVKYVKSEIK